MDTDKSDFGQYLTKGQQYYFAVTAVYSDNKVTSKAVRKTYIGDNNTTAYVKPVVYTAIENGKLVLKWNKIDSALLSGYKIVISKKDSTPQYPNEGYLYWITDKNTTSAVIDNSTAYNGGDFFGNYLVTGEKYYFNITAVYNDGKKVSGDAVRYVYPGDNSAVSLYPAPSVYMTNNSGILTLNWDRNSSTMFVGYRVVISKNDTTPQFQDNGYLYYYTNREVTSAKIDNSAAYNNGDFGKYLVNGQKYYFSVTAVYEDNRYVTSAPIEYVYNGTDNPEVYVVPAASIVDANGTQTLNWNKIVSSKFVGYRIVASKSNTNPKYTDSGYLPLILDNSKNSLVLDSSTKYTTADFGEYLIKDETYNIRVVAVYNDKSVDGNVVQFKYTGADNSTLFPKPVVSATTTGGVLALNWTKLESSQLVEYKVTVSKTNTAPTYSTSGYYKASFDKNTTSVSIDLPDAIVGSDVTKLENGTDYYFSVTAVYNYNKYVTSNTIVGTYQAVTHQ